MRDPSYVGSPEARRAGLGLATSISNAIGGQGVLPDAATRCRSGDDTIDDDGPRGPAGPRGPSIYDLQKGGLDRLLASQKEGFGQQRDLVEQLADLREEGMAGQEQFAKDTASARETFLDEQNATRQEKEQQRALERETQKNTELARQRNQLDEALRATGVDTNAATARLESLGIDPGQFADRETNETTAMLYSQSMSSANFVNQMDAISQSAAQFASDANDQATAQAMFGIGQDLAASLQTINQARQQGLIDDAMALQAIADQERTAEQQYDAGLTSLNVETARQRRLLLRRLHVGLRRRLQSSASCRLVLRRWALCRATSLVTRSVLMRCMRLLRLVLGMHSLTFRRGTLIRIRLWS